MPPREHGGRGRHAFEPAKLVAGLVLLAAGVVALLSSAGTVDPGPGPRLLPAVLLGLCAAGVVGAVSHGVRRRRARRRALRGLPGDGPPPDAPG
ncbi:MULTISPECIES: hypothetical protein [Streptomyces]|uniref:hypothetical protein n=1 Tax=Streptomyces TaxID=1883 RepID=UPI001D14FF89|nr:MULTISPECIES: hypothetical protein [Streptomyces]MCC3652202.1 hypothetical protein [Streptomyces sp. S07_1.15]WSQ73108.1 hypothetical protein OG463_17885 [Streptomyces xinghaiensis]